MSHSELCLKNAPIEEIAKIASDIIYQEKVEKKILSIKDVSGNSGAKTFICSEGEIPKCIVKVKGNESIMSSHPNTFKRVLAATENLRSNGIAPPIVLHGADFHIERSAGISVMEDFFHFNQKIAPPEKVAKLLAKLHSIPIDWYQNLKNEFLEQDLNISSILKPMPPFAPCWCLPWSGFDTQMPVLGVGNPNPETAKKIFKLELKTGVYKKIMQCSAFFPKSDAAKREVVVHNDFKPDNILYDPETKELTAIDYDLVQVGAAVMDFGLPYMMWLGSRFTNFNFRKEFIKSYLIESQLPYDDQNVKDMMLDCEINTIVAFPGLLANIYDAEIPLLRGIEHPTAKAGYLASGTDASPTGLELVDLLAEAVEKIRKDDDLTFSCLEDGLVVTLFKNNGLESSPLNSWLKEMQKNKMLRLFGIAETDGGELFVADHAKK
jgi:hypothetical protein|tara:strand:+ start:92 stop:1399 length:1308 start_codon:yes stop_codon:yes gene_type:complete